MPANKVIVNGETILDLTGDTVTAADVAQGKTFHLPDGSQATGTASGGGGSSAFSTDTWATIASHAEDGTAKSVYNVGDEKTIELSTGEQITVLILGFDHDDLSDGSGKAGITIGMKNLLATKYPMNSSSTNAGGWNESLMRTSTMATLLSQLPADLQSVIKQVNKKTSAGGQSTSIITSSDKLFLPSIAEVISQGAIQYNRDTDIKGNATTLKQEGKQYEYYQRNIGDTDLFGNCPQTIKYLSNGDGAAYSWSLRSAYIGTYKNTFWVVTENGGLLGWISSAAEEGVSFCFCV